MCAIFHVAAASFVAMDNPPKSPPGVIWDTFVISGPLCIYLVFEKSTDLYGKCGYLCDRKCENICIALDNMRCQKIQPR